MNNVPFINIFPLLTVQLIVHSPGKLWKLHFEMYQSGLMLPTCMQFTINEARDGWKPQIYNYYLLFEWQAKNFISRVLNERGLAANVEIVNLSYENNFEENVSVEREVWGKHVPFKQPHSATPYAFVPVDSRAQIFLKANEYFIGSRVVRAC